MKTERKLLTAAVFFTLGVVVGAGCLQLYLSAIQPNTAPALSRDEMYHNAMCMVVKVIW